MDVHIADDLHWHVRNYDEYVSKLCYSQYMNMQCEKVGEEREDIIIESYASKNLARRLTRYPWSRRSSSLWPPKIEDDELVKRQKRQWMYILAMICTGMLGVMASTTFFLLKLKHIRRSGDA